MRADSLHRGVLSSETDVVIDGVVGLFAGEEVAIGDKYGSPVANDVDVLRVFIAAGPAGVGTSAAYKGFEAWQRLLLFSHRYLLFEASWPFPANHLQAGNGSRRRRRQTRSGARRHCVHSLSGFPDKEIVREP
jgi:hypothetical protein